MSAGPRVGFGVATTVAACPRVGRAIDPMAPRTEGGRFGDSSLGFGVADGVADGRTMLRRRRRRRKQALAGSTAADDPRTAADSRGGRFGLESGVGNRCANDVHPSSLCLTSTSELPPLAVF